MAVYIVDTYGFIKRFSSRSAAERRFADRNLTWESLPDPLNPGNMAYITYLHRCPKKRKKGEMGNSP